MPQHELDARHLLCPLPVIRTQNQVKSLHDGDELVVMCTDPGTKADIPCWCRIYGHEVLSIVDTADHEIIITIRIEKK